ncbi:MAG TPA: tetratricopeptide repeat protein [Edaphobacter sp.]
MLRHYDDFELVIQSSGETYIVQLLNSPAGQASGQFIPPFTQVELSNFYGRIGQMRRSTRRVDSPDLEAAKKFGNQLFHAVFTGELLGQLRTSMDRCHEHGRGLRIRLRLKGVPALAELPWEFLYDLEQDHFLATSTLTPMVRYLDLPQSVPTLRVKPPLRVLVVLAGPRNLPNLDAEGEWERLKTSLAPLEANGAIQLERLATATLDCLRRRARGEPFHILHFIGHGGFDQAAGDGVLHFEDTKGMSDPVPGQLLGNILRDHDCLRLAVLNACEGARQSNQDPFSGVAQSLCQQRLPAVVAMQFEISDDAAKTFAEEFYGAIADGYPVDAAVSESRKALFSGRFGQEWATPVLYMRSSSGVLFEVQRRAKPAVEPKPVSQPEPKPQAAAAQPIQPQQAPPIQPRPAPPPPPPPAPPAQFRPGPTPLEQEAERRRREAERIKQERALFDLEQSRIKAERLKEEQRLKEERLRREQIEAQQRAEQERVRIEKARRHAEEQHLKDERLRFEQQQTKQKAEELRLREERTRFEEQQARAEEQRRHDESLRHEREAATPSARVQPPAPPPLHAAPPVVTAKKSHRVRNIILGIVGAFVLIFIIMMIIAAISEGGEKKSTNYTETPERHLLTGDQAMAGENYDNAITEYNAAIAQNADYADAHSHLCNAIAVKGEHAPGQKGDYDTAVSECEKAIQLAPNNAEAHSNLCNAINDNEAVAMALKGDFNRAIAECRTAIKLNPTYAEAYNNLCNAIGTRAEQPIAQPNDHNEAVAACRKAIALKPTYAAPHKNLGDLYRDSADSAIEKRDILTATSFYRQAATEYRNAVAIKPQYSEAQAQLGAALYKSNDSDAAIVELNKASEINPNDFVSFYWLGNVYLYAKKDNDLAAQNFTKAIALKPDLTFAEYGLSVALRAQGNSTEANQHLTRAYALNQNDKDIDADYKRYITGQPTSSYRDLSGSYSGTIRNTTYQKDARLLLFLEQNAEDIRGCLVVYPPLGGSGPVTGSLNNSGVHLQMLTPQLRIAYIGQAGEDNIAGSYTVFWQQGNELGVFAIRKTNESELPIRSVTRNCPSDADIARATS